MVLSGAAATVDAVLDGMERAGLVHIAAHGRFRADNPMFSSLQLADGLLYVHDLDRLRRTPQTVVLTACSAARAGVYGGDELLGTSVALLALGVRSVVAPLLPVRDDSARTLAVALHGELRDRADVPTAVAADGARRRRRRRSRPARRGDLDAVHQPRGRLTTPRARVRPDPRIRPSACVCGRAPTDAPEPRR